MNTNRFVRIVFSLLALLALMYARAGTARFSSQSVGPAISYSQFVQAVDGDQVLSGTISHKTNTFQGTFIRGNAPFTVILPPQSSQEYRRLLAGLRAHGVRYQYRRAAAFSPSGALLASIVLLLVLIFFCMFVLRQARMAAPDWKSRSL